jgi:adenosylcobinamide-GDP ribazoletransferase
VHRILKDPRIGTMGGLAIGIALLARYASLTTLTPPLILAALPAAAVLSRTAALIAMRLLPYVTGESRILSARPAVGPGLLVLASAVLLAAFVLFPVPSLVSFAALAVLWRIAWKRIGGSTGDVLGATIEIAEVVFLLALSAAARSNLAMIGLFSYFETGG